MKHEKINEALSNLQDRHIDEAAWYKKRRHIRWMGPVAALLAVAILVGALWRPWSSAQETPKLGPQISATSPHQETEAPSRTPIDHGVQLQYLAAKPEYPAMAGFPDISADSSYETWRVDQLAWHTQPEGYADSLADFWLQLYGSVLTGADGENIAFSPVNIYMALAMLAEITDGETRQQILDALGADSIEDIRTQAKQVWEGHYNDDGMATSILANSLWLEENYGFNMATANFLAQNYYASVFQGDLGSPEMNDALRAWLDEQTGGLLTDQIANVEMDPLTVLALASTVYYQSQWISNFQEEKNTQGIFHGAKGDTTETFMNTVLSYGPYYWGEHFSAVFLNLEGGSRMWLFLPDEGYSPEEIAEEIHAFLQYHPASYGSGYENQKDILVNLSLPKFDIQADLNLNGTLKEMGITHIFSPESSDFTPILAGDDGGHISDVTHAARVSVNEDGVTAAAYTLILRCGAGMPLDNEIDFVLDRPFLFCIESEDDLPLFTGIVNTP